MSDRTTAGGARGEDQDAAAITIHLVRHGETADNAVRRFQMPEVTLSEKGRGQATAVAETLAGSVTASMILASDYARAWETAGIIGARLGLPVTAEESLRERNFGAWRGQLYADLGEAVTQAYREPRMRTEGGESWADVFVRVAAFVSRLRADPPADELIMVTHGGTMSVILQHVEGVGIDAFTLSRLENCAVRTVRLEAVRGGG